MENINANATSDFCPPDSWFISRISPRPVNETRIITPVKLSAFISYEEKCSSYPFYFTQLKIFIGALTDGRLHSSPSADFMTSRAWPPGTSFLKTSEKFIDTCLNVNSISWHFCCSNPLIRSLIFSNLQNFHSITRQPDKMKYSNRILSRTRYPVLVYDWLISLSAPKSS